MAGALLLTLVLTATVLPVAGAIPLHALTLALIQSAQTPYWSPEPYMTGQLTLNKEYVPPREWNGSQFVPAIVSISASASDQDTYHMWFNDIYSPFMSLDVVTGDITGPAGYTDLMQWFGTYATGQFSTVDCGGQTSVLVTKTIHFNADDAAPSPGRNDDAVHDEKDIYVVLPNAVTTEWISHFLYTGTTDHAGDYWRHTVFYQPDNVSEINPAPSVSFSQYTLEEGDWALLNVDESGGLLESQVALMLAGEQEAMSGTVVLSAQNGFYDLNAMHRWLLALKYGSSLTYPGSIRLRQGFRVINPNQGPWFYLQNEHHFLGRSTGVMTPGECHVIKESYSITSFQRSTVICNYHNINCPY